MLAITRNPGESFLIGDDIEVVLVSCSPHKATIGIIAPRSVVIRRIENGKPVEKRPDSQPTKGA